MSNQEALPSPGQELGVMYKRWTLDCVVTIAHAVSLDFSDRPHLYENVDASVANLLTLLQGAYGFEPFLPDMDIRQRLMKPIFGHSDGHSNGNDSSDFQQLRLSAVTAAAKFAENAQPAGFPMLRNAVRIAADKLKIHMSIKGASLTQTELRTKTIFDIAQFILKDSDVSAVFGINGKIDQNWPLNSVDPRGANLIQNICSQLPSLPYGVISRDMFEQIQQTAADGFESIRKILDENIDDPGFDFTSLITELYAWGSDLTLVGGAQTQQQPSVQTTATGPAPTIPAAGPTSVTAPSGVAGYR